VIDDDANFPDNEPGEVENGPVLVGNDLCTMLTVYVAQRCHNIG
jgi:hypothetical protein